MPNGQDEAEAEKLVSRDRIYCNYRLFMSNYETLFRKFGPRIGRGTATG